MGRPAHESLRALWHVSKVLQETNEAPLFSVRQVADTLGVHPETIRRLIHDGRLDAVRVGRVLRIDRAAVSAFVDRQRIKPVRGDA
jgi:excisionase family DNA binding protein